MQDNANVLTSHPADAAKNGHSNTCTIAATLMFSTIRAWQHRCQR